MIFFDPPKALSLFVSSWTTKKDSAYNSIHSLNIKKQKCMIECQNNADLVPSYNTQPTLLF